LFGIPDSLCCFVIPKGPALTRGVLENSSIISYMLTMKLSVTLNRDEDFIWMPNPEALKNIKEAVALCLEVRAERSMATL